MVDTIGDKLLELSLARFSDLDSFKPGSAGTGLLDCDLSSHELATEEGTRSSDSLRPGIEPGNGPTLGCPAGLVAGKGRAFTARDGRPTFERLDLRSTCCRGMNTS